MFLLDRTHTFKLTNHFGLICRYQWTISLTVVLFYWLLPQGQPSLHSLHCVIDT